MVARWSGVVRQRVKVSVFVAAARVQVMAMKSARASGPVPMEEGRAVGGARWSQRAARFGIHRGSVFHVERERAAWLTCAEVSRSPWSGSACLGIATPPRMRSPVGGGDVLRDDGFGSRSTWKESTQSRPSRGRSSLRARGAEGQRLSRSPQAGGARVGGMEWPCLVHADGGGGAGRGGNGSQWRRGPPTPAACCAWSTNTPPRWGRAALFTEPVPRGAGEEDAAVLARWCRTGSGGLRSGMGCFTPPVTAHGLRHVGRGRRQPGLREAPLDHASRLLLLRECVRADFRRSLPIVKPGGVDAGQEPRGAAAQAGHASEGCAAQRRGTVARCHRTGGAP